MAPAAQSGKAAKKVKTKGNKQRKAERDSRSKQGPVGVDVLRLWVAMSDWTSDVAIGETVLTKPREAYRRLRNSCRFMLGNLHDFDPQRDMVPLEEMRRGDRYMLHRLATFAQTVERSHDEHATSRVVAAAMVFAGEDLSADYFHAYKDRLYCAQHDGLSRRAAQTVLHHALDTLLLAIGPITPFLAEEVHSHRREPSPPPPIERKWVDLPDQWLQPALASRWQLALAVRDEVMRMLHAAQQQKRLGTGGEAMVEVWVHEHSGMHEALLDVGHELNDLLGVCASRVGVLPRPGTAATVATDEELEADESVVSWTPAGELEMASPDEALRIVVRTTASPKCERCWRHVPDDLERGVEGVRLAGDSWCYRGCACGT